jgi:tRNA-splicing ligase RtcB
MQTLETTLKNGKPVFSWCPQIEEGALQQVKDIAQLPFVEHIAVMPDAHQGMVGGGPIGGVVACNGVIIPNLVGVDISCGVCVVRTNLTKENLLDTDLRKRIHASVERGIPMGFSHNNDKRRTEMAQKYGDKMQFVWDKYLRDCPEIVKYDAFFDQMGTLGGGNHFLSMDYDESGDVWIMVHSGSRNIGKKVCDHFNDVAAKLNQKWHSQSSIPFLPIDTVEGKQYLAWMNACMNFAFYNRQAMIEEVERDLFHILPNSSVDKKTTINIHHNYAAIENHFGKNVWVHRKGAVLAKEGHDGIIPGSQATASYITKGLGNPNSLMSSSHGAGRTKSRTAINTEMNNEKGIEEIRKSMEGIVFSGFGRAVSRKGKDLGMLDLSESSVAYKDIECVMKNQCDLVNPVHKLLPLINWKDVGEE